MSENIEKRMFTGPKMKSSNWVLDYCRHFQLKLGSVSYYGFFFLFFCYICRKSLDIPKAIRKSDDQRRKQRKKTCY